MRKEDLHFVTRLSSTTLREVVAQLPQDAQPQLWDRTKLMELSVEGKRYVIAGGEYRQKRDFARRTARLEKAERELKRLAAVRRKKPNPQKLASQAGRKLQQLKAHKYFQYQVDEQGQLQYQKNEELIQSEQNLDGLYLLHTDLETARCAKEQVLGNYKSLLAVEDAFCQLKSYIESARSFTGVRTGFATMCDCVSSLTGYAQSSPMNGEPKANQAKSNDCCAGCRPFESVP